jgi:hypothetical protein
MAGEGKRERHFLLDKLANAFSLRLLPPAEVEF